jgi:hypothetical protein
MYFEIVKTGNVLMLQKEGKANAEVCLELWDAILKKNSEHSGSGRYRVILEQSKSYNGLLCDYITVKAMLTVLQYKPVNDYIEYLSLKGYRIPVDKGDNEYANALISAITKSDNLVTKIKSKQKEIESFGKGKDDNNDESLAITLVNLSYALGLNYTLTEDILLSQYNAWLKILKAKQSANKQANGRI